MVLDVQLISVFANPVGQLCVHCSLLLVIEGGREASGLPAASLLDEGSLSLSPTWMEHPPLYPQHLGQTRCCQLLGTGQGAAGTPLTPPWLSGVRSLRLGAPQPAVAPSDVSSCGFLHLIFLQL